MYISELSLGPRGWVQVANFVIVGALFLIFAWCVKAEFRDGKGSRFGPILLIVIGLGFFLSGPAVMDPVTTPPDQMTLSGTLHAIFGAIVFTLIPIVCWIFSRRFRIDPKWRSLYGWTLAAALVTTAATILLSVANQTPAGSQLSDRMGWANSKILDCSVPCLGFYLRLRPESQRVIMRSRLPAENLEDLPAPHPSAFASPHPR